MSNSSHYAKIKLTALHFTADYINTQLIDLRLNCGLPCIANNLADGE